MSRSIRVRARQQIPGGGFDANGNSRQGKVEVWGKIIVTDYKRGGENLVPADLGLKSIEWLDIKHDDAVGGSDNQPRLVQYSTSAQQFYIMEEGANSFKEVAATVDPTLSFNAVGDALDDVELL